MEGGIFDIGFEHNGEKYSGWVHPSEKLDTKGAPVSFHVVLGGTSFGYLSFQQSRWNINEPRDKDLVEVVGKEIEKYYSLQKDRV